MRRLIAFTTFVLAVPAIAAAHVGVRPRESKLNAEEHYSVRVPTEGAVSTTSVRFEVPAGVTVLDVPKPSVGTVDVKREGDRIVEITWTREIKPKESAEFMFHAKNPSSGEAILWKAHQNFADGTTTSWVDAPGAGRRTGPVTKLIPTDAAARSTQAGNDEADRISKWLDGYDAAFIAKDLEKLGNYYHPDVTIYEGGGIDNGWADYRDTHLGPELKAFENLQFGHTERKVHVLSPNTAYVTSLYFIKAKMGERTLDSGGLETLVLLKGADGAWKIRHAHTSARARRPAGGL
ncbi:MAG: DUF1775 domain-containing protein [Vicinamibacterales bacterium]